MEGCINKVVISDEAQFDYQTLFGKKMPKTDIKHETEEYLENIISARGFWQRYFRAKYYDDGVSRMLVLFFDRGMKFGKMQMWELKGICEENDWNELLEEFGVIRAWLNTPLEPIDERDWVWDMRVMAEARQKALEDYNDKN